MVVDDLVNFVKPRRSNLRVGPSDQQLVLLVLKLGRTTHVKATKIFAHYCWVGPISDRLQTV